MARKFLVEARRDAHRRYPPIARLVKRYVKEGVVEPVIMDLGCGPALLLPEIAKVLPRARLVGIDPSKAMLEMARTVVSGAAPALYELKDGSAEAIPLEDGSVDIVIALKNFHEWEDAPGGLEEVARVLKPGGILILSDSSKAYPYWKLRFVVALVRMVRGRRATGKYLGPYQDAYRPEEVVDLLSDAGFEIIEQDPKGIEFSFIARGP
jgi:ubiquinone/menaquinone biosynthesis C-methylase UbiE